MVAKSDALVRAIEAAGGVSKLAETLGVSQPAISQWDRVPAERVIAVERATFGRVTRHELRPDLYPDDYTEQDLSASPRAEGAAAPSRSPITTTPTRT